MPKLVNIVGRPCFVFSLMCCLFGFSACVNTNKAVYFPKIKNDTLQSSIVFPQTVIQSNDLLSITISSQNPEASAFFNLPVSSTSSFSLPANTPVGTAAGYLVNEAGEIQLPMLGDVKAAGLTKEQLKRVITTLLSSNKYLVDPVVTIRYLNFRVTVLGEVNKPSVMAIPSEKISLLEAIGLAGDITVYGRRDNVLLIREENDRKIMRRLNLNSSQLFTSEFYYLKSNDIIYVEPNKARVGSVSRTQQWLPMALSALSIVVILGDRLIK